MTTIGGLTVADEGWVLVLYGDRNTAASAWRRSPLYKGAGLLHRWFGEGLHYRAAEEMWRLLAVAERDYRRFVMTQNPSVIDLMTFESAEDARGRLLVVRDLFGVATVMNITQDEASQFWAAYEAGVEHVSEILRTRGLW